MTKEHRDSCEATKHCYRCGGPDVVAVSVTPDPRGKPTMNFVCVSCGAGLTIAYRPRNPAEAPEWAK